MDKKIWVPLLVTLALIAAVVVIRKAYNATQDTFAKISTFEECKKAGYPVTGTNPEKCKVSDSKVFANTGTSTKNTTTKDPDKDTTETGTAPDNSLKDFGAKVGIPLNGKATFKDGMTVQVKEINDSTCKPAVYCVWQGEITVTLAVPQLITLGTVNNKSITMNGYIYTLVSATPTGVVISVQKIGEDTASGGCYVGGCSGQICSDSKDVVSTCEYLPKYVCFKEAKCEKQENGICGWTQTAELKACLISKG